MAAMSPENRRPAPVQTVVPGKLVRACRPGYSAAKCPVGIGPVQEWIDAAQDAGVVSIICLLADEHLALYAHGDLLESYRVAGFEVCHIPCGDHAQPPLSPAQLERVLAAYRMLPKPVLVHCSAGIDRTGAAVRHILDNGA